MKNIDIYYESIKQVYNQIEKWENRPTPFPIKLYNLMIGTILIIFGLSLIPIIPSLIVYFGNQYSWHLKIFDFSQTTTWTYVLAWFIFSFLSSLLLTGVVWLDNNTNLFEVSETKDVPQSLSADQLTFILVYGAFKELKIYFISRIDQHANNSLGLLEKLMSRRGYSQEERFQASRMNKKEISLQSMDNFGYSNRKQPSLIRQVSIARNYLHTFGKYPWFQIDEKTKSRLQALISFRKKIMIRLQKREDLPAVLALLDNLSMFFYAYLPEHQTNMDTATLAQLHLEGIKALDGFVQDENGLIELAMEHKTSEKTKLDKPTFFQKLRGFYFSNVFFRFTVCLIILFVISSGLVFLINLQFPDLDINIMVSMIIATSITGAVGLAVFSPKAPGSGEILQSLNKKQDKTVIQNISSKEESKQ